MIFVHIQFGCASLVALPENMSVQVCVEVNDTWSLQLREPANHTTSIKAEVCRDNTSYEDMEAFFYVDWWLQGVLHICISIAGLIANSISIPVLISKKLKNLFNRTLAILAGFDAVYNLLDLLESIRRNHYYGNDTCGPVPYHESLHKYLYLRILYPLQAIVMMASIYATVIVAFERYFAVSRPISAFVNDGNGSWKKVLTYITPMVIFTILFNMPKFFEFYAIEVSPGCLMAQSSPGQTNLTNLSTDMNGVIGTMATNTNGEYQNHESMEANSKSNNNSGYILYFKTILLISY